MAHPSNLIAKNPYYINGDVTATLSGNHYFHTITCLAAAVLILKGGGIFEYIDVSGFSNNAAAAKYIDPLTGLPFTAKSVAIDSDHGDGFYEAISTQGVTFTIPSGATIYGRFTEIDSGGSDKVIAYR